MATTESAANAPGSSMSPTKYQRTHRPTSRTPVLCASRAPLNRFEPRCVCDCHKDQQWSTYGWVDDDAQEA